MSSQEDIDSALFRLNEVLASHECDKCSGHTLILLPHSSLPVRIFLNGKPEELACDENCNVEGVQREGVVLSVINAFEKRRPECIASRKKEKESGEPRHPMSNEAFYDAVVAPALLALGKQCTDRGMSLVATVEYGPNERGSTFAMVKNAGLEMVMMKYCALTGKNVDSYFIGLSKYMRDHNIDASQSAVLRILDL